MNAFIARISRCRKKAATDGLSLAVGGHSLNTFDDTLMSLDITDETLSVHVPNLQALERC